MPKTKGSFKLEPVFDPNPKEPLAYTMESQREPSDATANGPSRVFETQSQRRSRYISLVIINITAFVFLLGFSIVLTGVYPYMELLDKDADKTFLGWVVAAYPLGQLVASPLVGWLGNKLGSIRLLCVITMSLYTGGFIFFSCIGALPEPRRYYFIVARLIIGFAAGSITLCFSYVSAATTIKERTFNISMISFSQSMGFILGPVIQAALTPLGGEEGDGIDMGSGLVFNMYTAAGWISAALGFFNLFLFMPGIFREHNIAKREAEFVESQNNAAAKQGEDVKVKRDNPTLIVCIIGFAFVTFIFIFIETMATPLTMDQLAWTEEEAVARVGIMLAIGGIVNALGYAAGGPLARKFGERNVLLVAGMLPLIIASICFFPFAGNPPKMQGENCTATDTRVFATPLASWNPSSTFLLFDELESTGILETASNVTDDCRGCPLSQDWCTYTPALSVGQLGAGFIIICIGYPFAMAMATSLYSKILGPGPQGTWMGILSAAGCVSRILCPIYVSNIYTAFGTWAAFGSLCALMSANTILFLVFYKRLVPLAVPDLPEKK